MKTLKFYCLLSLFIFNSTFSINYTEIAKWTYLSSLPLIYGYCAFDAGTRSPKKERILQKNNETISQEKDLILNETNTTTKLTDLNQTTKGKTNNRAHDMVDNSEIIFNYLSTAATVHLFEKIIEKNPGTFFEITAMPFILATIIYGVTKELRELVDDYN